MRVPTSISTGEAIGIAGLFLAIVSIVLAVIALRRPRLAYRTRSLTLIGQPDAVPYGDISILFNGAPVPRLVATRLGFWNAGNTTVRRADIVEKDPLTVCFEERTTILGSRTVSETRAMNECRLSLNRDVQSCAFLTFDYLNRGDGAVFEIIHTGSRGGPSVKGSIRGFPKGAEYWGYLSDRETKKNSVWQEVGPTLAIAAPIFLALILHGLHSLVTARHPTLASVFEIAAIVIGSAVAVLMATAVLVAFSLMTLSYWRRLPKSLSRDS